MISPHIIVLQDIFFVEFLWKNTGYTEQLTVWHVMSFQGFVGDVAVFGHYNM